MTSCRIHIAADFSPNPAGRVEADGPFSGEKFRESLLLPAFRSNDVVQVVLDDTGGYGSSFLEEAFGGLVRAGFSPSQVKEKLQVISSRQIYETKIWSYINRAALH